MPNVIGMFENYSEAQRAVERMINDGIDRDQISSIGRDSDRDRESTTTEHTSGAGKGAGIGAAVGGIGGLIAGIAGLAIPGIGPILAAGPLAAAIGGALGGAGLGAAAGGLIGALTDMGVPEHEARHYEDQVRQGKILVTVRADSDDEADRAADIMDADGDVNVEGRRENPYRTAERDYRDARVNETSAVADTTTRPDIVGDSDFSTRESARADLAAMQRRDDIQAASSEAGTLRENRSSHEDRTIPVTEEELVVGKRAVESGRVRVYSRVKEKPVEESVRLREERVNVERRAVDRPVTDADRKDDVVIEVTEMREEPVVGKKERVVEEIVVGKTSDERTETVRDTVRRRDVEVERNDTRNRESTPRRQSR
jgi:uncharacterized protein (TIGR02271 family)